MSILHALLLGIVQGFTEFLPISSSAHLILIPKLFGWDPSPLVFDTSLHIGTALAIGVYFLGDFLKITRKMVYYLAVGTIPVMVIGFILDNTIEYIFRNIGWVALFLILGSIFMYIAEFVSKRKVNSNEITLKKSLLIGASQVFALFPGISRSGVTISTGLLTGLSREEAARFSFLLSAPAVVAAASYKLLTTFSMVGTIGYTPWILGIITSFVSGMLAIKFLLTFLKSNSLSAFVIYRVILAAFILLVLFLR